MAINIDTLVHNEFSRSAADQLEKITGKPANQVKSGVDRAVTEILDNLSLMAREESGRQTIYEASRYCDDGLIDDPAIFFSGKDQQTAISDSNNALSGLLGSNTRSGITEAVRSTSGLTAQDADTITGYVAPGVLGVMKRQMLNGAVLDNSDGIGQMLLGEVVTAKVGGAGESVDHSVPKNAPRHVSTTTNVNAGSTTSASQAASVSHSSGGSVSVGAGGAAVAHGDGADLSWLFRWMLPVILLGGLMLAGLRNCGPQAPVAVVDTSITDGLQAQVSSLTAERDEALGDRETAVAEIDRLTAELETASVVDTSELDAANVEIASLKEQLAVPVDTSELDAANAEIASLKEQLAEPVDTSELDAANAEIASLKDQLAQPADTSAIDAAAAEIARLQNQLANVPPPVDNTAQINSLQSSVDDGTLKIAQLESELGAVRTKRDELEQSLAAFQAERTTIEDRNTELKEKLLTVAGAKNRLDGEIAGLQTAVANGEASISEQQGTIESLTAERDGALNAVEQEKATVTELKAEVTAANDALALQQEATASVEAELEDVQGKIAIVQSNLGRATDDASTQRKAAVAAQNEIVALQQSIAEGDAKLAKVTKGRGAAITTVTDLARKLRASETALAGFEGTEEELAKVTKGRSAAIATVTDLARKLRASESALAAFEGTEEELAKVTKGRSAAIATVTDLARKLRASESALAGFEGTEEELAKVTEDRDAAVNTVEDLTGKLRSSETQKQELEQTLAEAEAAIQAKKDEVAVLSISLSDRLGAAGVGNVFVAPIEDSSAVGITMGSSDLYSVGSATLSSQGIETLSTVGAIVSEYPDWRVDVEGHTDGQPIGSVLRETYPTNWELSVARAAAAVRYLQSDIGIPADKLSVRGFGEHKPVDTNETREGREANRRIELILRRQ